MFFVVYLCWEGKASSLRFFLTFLIFWCNFDSTNFWIMQQFLRNIFLITVFLFVCFPVAAQVPENITTDIGNALLKADTRALSDMFTGNVELDVEPGKGKYSKNQAQMVLKEWFGQNIPRSYELKQEGKTSSSFYIIGYLHCNSGLFRVYILLNESSGKMNIHYLSLRKNEQ